MRKKYRSLLHRNACGCLVGVLNWYFVACVFFLVTDSTNQVSGTRRCMYVHAGQDADRHRYLIPLPCHYKQKNVCTCSAVLYRGSQLSSSLPLYSHAVRLLFACPPPPPACNYVESLPEHSCSITQKPRRHASLPQFVLNPTSIIPVPTSLP